MNRSAEARNDALSISPREAMTDFLHSLQGTGRKQNTIIYYRSALRQFVSWMEDQSHELTHLNARQVRAYFTYREDDCGVSRTTLYHDWTAAKAWLRYCRRQGWIDSDPMGDLRFRKPRPAPVVVPDDGLVLALLKAVEDRWNPKKNPKARYTPERYRTRIKRRDYAILLALYETGARRSEIVCLCMGDVKDLNTARPYLILRDTKTGQDRQAFVTRKWAEALKDYLRVRPACDSERLFLGEYKEPLSANWFSKKLVAYCEFAGIPSLTPQALRRYRSSKLVQSKSDLYEASLILGNSPTVLQAHYLDRNPERLREKWEASLEQPAIANKRTKRQRA